MNSVRMILRLCWLSYGCASVIWQPLSLARAPLSFARAPLAFAQHLSRAPLSFARAPLAFVRARLAPSDADAGACAPGKCSHANERHQRMWVTREK